MRRLIQSMLICVFTVLAYTPVSASEDFSAGSRRFSLLAGSGSALQDSYTVIGLGAGYYPVDGLELGAEVKFWLGGDADIYELSPSATYIMTQFESFKPYVGVLFRKTLIEKYDNLSALGGRVGVVLESGDNLSFRVGLTAVRYHDCDSNWIRRCTEVTPEVSLGVAF